MTSLIPSPLFLVSLTPRRSEIPARFLAGAEAVGQFNQPLIVHQFDHAFP